MPSGHGEVSDLAVVRTPSWRSAEYELKRKTGGQLMKDDLEHRAEVAVPVSLRKNRKWCG